MRILLWRSRGKERLSCLLEDGRDALERNELARRPQPCGSTVNASAVCEHMASPENAQCMGVTLKRDVLGMAARYFRPPIRVWEGINYLRLCGGPARAAYSIGVKSAAQLCPFLVRGYLSNDLLHGYPQSKLSVEKILACGCIPWDKASLSVDRRRNVGVAMSSSSLRLMGVIEFVESL